MRTHTLRRGGIGLVAGLALALAAPAPARADFDPQIGQPGSKGIAATSPLFQGWATSVAGFERGPQSAATAAAQAGSTASLS